MKRPESTGSATLHKRMMAFSSILGTLAVLGFEPVTGIALALFVVQYLSVL